MCSVNSGHVMDDTKIGNKGDGVKCSRLGCCDEGCFGFGLLDRFHERIGRGCIGTKGIWHFPGDQTIRGHVGHQRGKDRIDLVNRHQVCRVSRGF